MTPKEYAYKLHMKYYFMLPNNGYIDQGLLSINMRWKEGIKCALASVDIIFDFMEMDDDLHKDCHFANSKWASYFIEVKNELNKRLEESNTREINQKNIGL
jgi:hypothetical protein